MPKKRRKISKTDISQKDVEAWIASNPDYRVILKETLVDYVAMEVTKKLFELKKDIKVQISGIIGEKYSNRPEAIGPVTVGVFLSGLAVATRVFLNRWKQRYHEPEIELEECRGWASGKAKEWMHFFHSWELDNLLKDREAIRKVIAQIVERYLPESFWNKLEGNAMKSDPAMRRLIMRDMLGGE